MTDRALDRNVIVIASSFLLTLMLACGSLIVGPILISGSAVADWLLGGNDSALTNIEQIILWDLRLPRILNACLVGGSLGISGAGFQALFRNVLADPYIIGASSGAALGVTLSVVIGFQFSLLGMGAIPLAAMVGAIAAVLLVFSIGSLGRHSSSLSLLLAGVALSSMINAMVSLLMYLREDKVVAILAWLMGSLADNDWKMVMVTFVTAAFGLAIIWSSARAMDAYSLGDAVSQSLGMDLTRFRILMVTGSSIATAAAVGVAGIIGFVGLIAPHIARALVAPRHVFLIPMSGCVGAIMVLVADAIARTIVAPAELPVGIVTAILGCPFFLFLLKSRSLIGDMTS